MTALAGGRLGAPALPMHPNVLLSGSERIMEGPFGIVTQRLSSLGSCSIESLARSPKADLEGFDLPSVFPDLDLLTSSSMPAPDAGRVVSDGKENPKVSPSMQFVAQLHQTCVGAFGNSEALRFEFLDEGGDEGKCSTSIHLQSNAHSAYHERLHAPVKSTSYDSSATFSFFPTVKLSSFLIVTPAYNQVSDMLYP